MGRAGWPDARRAARGRRGVKLQPGRWVEGHLGGRRWVKRSGADGRHIHPHPANAWHGSRRSGSRPAARCAQPAATTTAAATTRMLSRVSEAFFWIGRYLEKAEGTARILEVVIQQTTGQAGEPANVAAARLPTVMG